MEYKTKVRNMGKRFLGCRKAGSSEGGRKEGEIRDTGGVISLKGFLDARER